MILKLAPGIEKIAVDFLRNGKIIICPTDTIYGFSCKATDQNAIEKIYSLKGIKKGPLILLTLAEWVYNYIENPSKFEPIFKLWGKPVTLILPVKKGLFPEVLYNEKNGVGFRAPKTPFVVNLLAKLGEPIVSTSANKHGEEPLYKPEEIIERFGVKVELIIDAGELVGKPSTVIDCLDFPKLTIIREGIIGREEIEKEISDVEFV